MKELQNQNQGAPGVSIETDGDAALVVQLSGGWRLQKNPASAGPVQKALETSQIRSVRFDAQALSSWDSSILIFLTKVTALCRTQNIATDRAGLPQGIRRILELAEIVPEQEGARQATVPPTFVGRVGSITADSYVSLTEMLRFLGAVTLAFLELLKSKARYRKADLFLIIQECGPQALPIVTLISFLVGVIMAFVGAIQLQQFGAQIYVADLVGIVVVREMGAMMTGIIMAGRTGAAFAAKLGTMKVTQEIDALTTLGLSPLEFLVLPRMIALCLMMPLLCLYSDLMGVLGGAAVGLWMLDLSWTTYYHQTVNAITLTALFGGVFKSVTYGVLIALSGCLRGMQCGGSASAVGEAATSAVVTSIVFIVVACGVLAVVFHVIGI
ncbi:MAG TPA: ABC transporter permease [Candidatus Binatus sp.]|nr:ABC transporter permease [Candidatus Binatus sp.]